jgi:NADP-reducing hydrogenase subunit HndB
LAKSWDGIKKAPGKRRETVMATSEGKPEGKVRGLKDLQDIQRQIREKTALREDGYRACITVHMGTCGIASGAREVLNALQEELGTSNRDDIRLATSGCIGVCAHEPAMTVEILGTPSVLYGDLNPQRACDVLREHVLKGTVMKDWVIVQTSES